MASACAYGLHHVVSALLARGISPAPVNPDGRLSLHDAVAGGHTKVVQLLLGAKVDPNACAATQPPGKQLPLTIAAKLSDIPTARLLTWILRNKGGDVEQAEADGVTTPLQLVLSSRPEETTLLADLQAAAVALPLPAGWSESYDSKLRKPYYYHAKTRATRWEPPIPDGAFA